MLPTRREVIELSSEVFPYLGAFMLLDCVGICASGCLRGCGQQLLGAGLVFLGYYVLGIPTMVALIFFTDIGVLGETAIAVHNYTIVHACTVVV